MLLVGYMCGLQRALCMVLCEGSICARYSLLGVFSLFLFCELSFLLCIQLCCDCDSIVFLIHSKCSAPFLKFFFCFILLTKLIFFCLKIEANIGFPVQTILFSELGRFDFIFIPFLPAPNSEVSPKNDILYIELVCNPMSSREEKRRKLRKKTFKKICSNYSISCKIKSTK